MNYSELIEEKKSICSSYISHYVNNGHVEIAPLPLNYKKDITLDFTTCTICAAKDNIRQRKKGKDYVMIQPALRNTHIEVLGKFAGEDCFFSFFSMMGGFKYYSDGISHIEEFSKVVKSEFEFLKGYFATVILTIPIQYFEFLKISDDVLKYLYDNNCIIKYSDCDEENLRWKYGIVDVEGYGTRWEVANKGDLVNWGNTINVIVDGKPFGVDFGGGVESLIYAKLNLKNSIYANDGMTDLTRNFCLGDSINEKIIDCIISAMCIIANKEKIILRDRYILDTYMNILNSLMVLNDISKQEILSIVHDINSHNIPFLSGDNVFEKFESYLEYAMYIYSVVLESRSINMVLKLLDLCYDENNSEWKKNKKIIKNHYLQYFSNLSEVELLALQKTKRLERKGGKKYD